MHDEAFWKARWQALAARPRQARRNLRVEYDPETGRVRAWSYSTCLLDTLPDGRIIGNITRYSVTTSRHQTLLGVRAADVLLDHVLWGIYCLDSYYFNQLDSCVRLAAQAHQGQELQP